MKKIFYGLGVIVGLIVILHFLPVTIPYSINVPGKIIHSAEWILQRGDDGSVMSTFYDHKTGFIKNYSAVQIERGDAVSFQLSPSVLSKETINPGDIVGMFHSNNLYQELSELNRELALAKASLVVSRTGEKIEIVNETKAKLAFAEENLLNHNRIFSRQDSLYQHNLISREEFELTKSMKQVFEIETAIAKAHLQVVQSGDKPEQIDFFKSEIEAIEAEIQVIEEKSKYFTLICPIAGKIYQSISSDTLLTVGDTTCIVLIPISMKYFADVESTQPVNFEFPNNKKASGKIIRKEAISRVLNNEQVFLVYAEMEDFGNQAPIGFIFPCSITIKSLKPLPYFFQVMKSILS